MPKQKRYTIKSETFLQTWYDALSSEPKLTMLEFIEKLKIACDKDPKNADFGLTRGWTEAAMSSKMDYYRRSYELDIEKPVMSKRDSKNARKERKKKFSDLFVSGGFAVKRAK